jgi:hypothetical protein
MTTDALSKQAAEDAEGLAAAAAEREAVSEASTEIDLLGNALGRIVDLVPPDGLAEAQAIAREALALQRGR